VASLQWWRSLDEKTRDLIQRTIYEAAVYQRRDNRSKDAARLALLKQNGMQVEENPDLDAFRAKVTDLKDMDLYQDPRVRSLLLRILEATK
jgi:TRAP-type C4-dicarboxylate transport system substrate-binding protein